MSAEKIACSWPVHAETTRILGEMQAEAGVTQVKQKY